MLVSIVLGFTIASLGVGVLFRAACERPAWLWTVSWLSVIAAGGALLFGPDVLGPLALGFLSTLFPGFQLAGALALVRSRAPTWVGVATVLAGLIRVAGDVAGDPGLGTAIGVALEPPVTLAAAVLLAGHARGERGTGELRAVALLLAVAALSDGATAWLRGPGAPLPGALVVLWFGLTAVGLPLQLHVAARRDLRRLAQLRHQAESELSQSQERFRALTDSSFDLVAELDGDERFTYVNPAYEKVLGYPREHLLGSWPTDLLHPDDVPAAAPFAEEASRAGRASGLVVRARHRDGHYVSVENAASAFLTTEGQRRWVMNSRDVTLRREREALQERDRERLEEIVGERTAALQASEARFRALADHAPELIAELDSEGRFTFANAGFRELLGRDPAQLIGTRPDALVHPDDLAESQAGWSRALTERDVSRRLHRVRHADGSWRWFEHTARAYRTAGGELRIVSIGRDVTEARLAEAERLRLQAHMQEVQRLESLGVLAGGIAHDFNNLLAVVLGNAALLEAGAGTAAETDERLRRIQVAARHAEALTDQMLTYAGRSVAELAPLDLSALVRETEDLLRAVISKKCTLRLDLDSDLPPVHGDPTRLRQVLVNLATNAAEAEGEAGGEVRVRTQRIVADAGSLASAHGVAERRPGLWVVLEVSDDGPGIADERRMRIFEPFFSTKGVGRGLGLAAVLGIANAHDGLIQVESAAGRGTTFRLLLPPGGEVRSEASAPPSSAESGAPAGLVLVVDDDEAVRETAEALLELAGFRVETAPGGRAALARVRAGGVDVVLLDLVMPEVSGAEVLRVLAAEQPDLPVVLASGYRRELVQLEPEGAFGFAQKPFDPDRLSALLRDALRKRAASRTAR